MKPDVREELVALLPRLRRFAYSLCGSLEEADDLVQSACLRALGRLDQFEPGTRLDSWMFRIVQTVWIDTHRKNRRRGTSTDLEAVEAAPHDARIGEQVEARQSLAIVRDAMQKLPEDQRAVLGLVTIDGMTYQEAAAVLDIPIGTVMSRLARARTKLSAALEQRQARTGETAK